MPSARRESQGGEYRELGDGKAPGGTTDMVSAAATGVYGRRWQPTGRLGWCWMPLAVPVSVTEHVSEGGWAQPISGSAALLPPPIRASQQLEAVLWVEFRLYVMIRVVQIDR